MKQASNFGPVCLCRYCPSLETKFKRFPGRTHHVWLEPEGLNSHVLYPNGLSNSLEPEDQIELLRTVPGVLALAIQTHKLRAPHYQIYCKRPGRVHPLHLSETSLHLAGCRHAV